LREERGAVGGSVYATAEILVQIKVLMAIALFF